MKFFSYIKKYRLVASIIVFFFVITCAFLIKVKSSKAILGFGGSVMSVTVCTCNPIPSYYVVIGPPSGGTFIFTPASIPHEYDNIWGIPFGSWVTEDTWVTSPTGPWVLGSYIPGPGICLMIGDPCYPLAPALGIVSEYGTSAGPAN